MIQANVKFRTEKVDHPDGDLFGMLKRLINDQQDSVFEEVVRILKSWVIQDSKDDVPLYILSPAEFLSAIFNRVCFISGHVWFEYFKLSQTNTALKSDEDQGDSVDNKVCFVEFLPNSSHLFFEIQKTIGNEYIDLHNLTKDIIVSIFSPLLKQKFNLANEILFPEVAGLVLLTDSSSPISDSWKNDRQNSFKPCSWPTNQYTEAQILSLIAECERLGYLYSYSPDRANKKFNCLTWANLALEFLIDPNWLQSIISQKCSSLKPDKVCDLSKAVVETGRMKEIKTYVVSYV